MIALPELNSSVRQELTVADVFLQMTEPWHAKIKGKAFKNDLAENMVSLQEMLPPVSLSKDIKSFYHVVSLVWEAKEIIFDN